jgi:hypothetical protein
MNETANPVIMAFLFILRCLVPLGILLGISYLLRRMELIIEPPAQPQNEPKSSEPKDETTPAPVEPVRTKAPAEKRVGGRTPSPKKKKSSGKKPTTPKRKKKES